MREWLRYTEVLRVKGRFVEFFGPANWSRPGMLTFAETAEWRAKVHPEAICLDSRQEFYDLFLEAAKHGDFEKWDPDIRAQVKPGAVIGGDAFKTLGDRISPSVGGVKIAASATIGSCTCIDRGIWGEFTEIGENVHIDNLVHVAHSVILEDGVTVVAGVVIGGWTIIGKGAWIGMNASLRDNISIGHHALVGAGAVVVADVLPHALVYGNPAKQHGWVCACRKPLNFEGDLASCSCGRCYGLGATPEEVEGPNA